jgi:hypothetical protein
VATGQFAKGSADPLATGVDDNEETQGDDSVATSSGPKPSKRAKVADGDGEVLAAAFDRASERLSNAIKEAATADKDMPEGLFDAVNDLPGFEHIHRSMYFAHLVNNPHVARAFNILPFDHKLTWVSKFVADNFPGC